MTRRRAAAGAVLLALAAACGDATVETPPADTATDVSRPEPLIVFASHEDPAFLPGLFADYTRRTGVRVTVRHRDDAANVDDVVTKLSSPQPDVLITRSVAGAWRAADEGMLRPLVAAKTEAGIPDRLRDPDGYWVALGYSIAVIVYDAGRIDADAVSDYAMLGGEALRGRLCLSSSTLPSNLTLVANLVAVEGRRPAEIIVRGWIRNLAVPPFDSEGALLDAIARGTCALGIVTSRAAAMQRDRDTGASFAVHVPQPVYGDAVAAGVGRHARNPDAAADFIDWLSRRPPQAALAVSDRLYPGNPAARRDGVPNEAMADSSLVNGGAFAEEAILLAERARYP